MRIPISVVSNCLYHRKYHHSMTLYELIHTIYSKRRVHWYALQKDTLKFQTHSQRGSKEKL